jgi:hypothetical protein
MKTEIKTHVIKLPNRTGEMRVTERPDSIVMELSFSDYGDLGDIAEVSAWLRSIGDKYEDDPRSVYMPHPLNEELAILP